MRRIAFNTPGEAHSLTFSTYGRTKVFANGQFCEIFLDVLGRERTRLSYEVWAYVLMPDHVHLLLWPKDKAYEVSEVLRALKQPVSMRALSLMRFERDPMLPRLWNEPSQKHRLWQAGGGHDRNLVSRGLLSKTVEYIHDNPVAADGVAGYGTVLSAPFQP